MMLSPAKGLLLMCLAARAAGVAFRGSPWPIPAKISTREETLALDRNSFRFHASGVSCDILEEAFVRYFRIIFDDSPSTIATPRLQSQTKLTSLDVKAQNQCEKYPSMGIDEACTYHLINSH